MRPSQSRRHDDGRDRWHVVDASPRAKLATMIGRYGWWSEQTGSFDTRRELAGTAGTLIINLAADLELVDAAGRRLLVRAGEGFVAGPAQATSLSRATGTMAGVHIRAPLDTLARLAGLPLPHLVDRVVSLADCPGIGAERLGADLLETYEDEQRWRLLDRWAEQRLAATTVADGAMAMAAARLAAGARVQAIADDLGITRKRLACRFRAAIGLEPRAFAGLARFERFAALLKTEPAISLADAAVVAGYADQPHLTREVGRYAATTPGGLRSRLLPEGGGVRN